MRRHLGYGALSGLAGGMALAIVLLLLGEGPIGQAVGLEQHTETGHGEEMFSRGTQQLGGALAAVIYGIALGAVFAVVFVAVRRYFSTHDDWRASAQLAGIGFLTIFLIPFLKYPPNPPAVGAPDTIGRRTGLYLVMLAWSAVATWGAWLAARSFARRGLPDHIRPVAVAASYVALIVAGFTVLPGSPDVVGAPATLVWNFRLSSLAGAVAFWSVAGITFGWLCLRYVTRTATANTPEARVAEPV